MIPGQPTRPHSCFLFNLPVSLTRLHWCFCGHVPISQVCIHHPTRTWCKSTNVSMIASWVSATASDDEVVIRMQLAESWHFLHCLVSPWSQSQYKSLYCSSEASFMAFSIGHFLAKCDVNVSGTEWYSFSFGYLQSSTHPWWSYRSYTCNLINDRQLNDHIRVHGTHYLRVCCRSASTSFPAFTAD